MPQDAPINQFFDRFSAEQTKTINRLRDSMKYYSSKTVAEVKAEIAKGGRVEEPDGPDVGELVRGATDSVRESIEKSSAKSTESLRRSFHRAIDKVVIAQKTGDGMALGILERISQSQSASADATVSSLAKMDLLGGLVSDVARASEAIDGLADSVTKQAEDLAMQAESALAESKFAAVEDRRESESEQNVLVGAIEKTGDKIVDAIGGKAAVAADGGLGSLAAGALGAGAGALTGFGAILSKIIGASGTKKTLSLLDKLLGPKGIIGKIAKPIASVVSSLSKVTGLSGVLKAAGKLGGLVSKLFLPIAPIVAAFEVITGAINGYDVDGAMGAVVGGIGGLLNFLTLGLFDFDVFYRAVIGGVEGIIDAAGSIFRDGLSLGSIGGILSGISDIAGGLVEGIVDGATGAMSAVLGWFGFDGVASGLEAFTDRSLVDVVAEWFGDIYNSITGMFMSLRESVFGFVESVIGWIVDNVPFAEQALNATLGKNVTQSLLGGRKLAELDNEIAAERKKRQRLIELRQQGSSEFDIDDLRESSDRLGRLTAERRAMEGITPSPLMAIPSTTMAGKDYRSIREAEAKVLAAPQPIVVVAPSTTTNVSGGQSPVIAPTPIRYQEPSFRRVAERDRT